MATHWMAGKINPAPDWSIIQSRDLFKAYAVLCSNRRFYLCGDVGELAGDVIPLSHELIKLLATDDIVY